MKVRNEGVRRLSIFWGGLCSFAWLVFGFIATTDFLILIVGSVICFIIPYVLVTSINWVVSGFKQNKSNNQKK